MNIKRVIKQNGWTLDKLAKKMGTTQPALSHLLKDGANPSINKLKEIASILGISLSELVADEDERKEAASSAVCPHCGKPVKVRTVLEGEG